MDKDSAAEIDGLASRLLLILPFEFLAHVAHLFLLERWFLLACPEFRVDEWWVPLE
jgi:hypothetical protein